MSFIVNARIIGNERVVALLTDLAAIGIHRQRVTVVEPDSEPEHGADPISAGGTLWGVIGGTAGAVAGWLILSWTQLPWIGALWGAVVGSLCGARFGSYAAHAAGVRSISSTRLGIAACDQAQADEVRTMCASHQAWAIEISPKAGS